MAQYGGGPADWAAVQQRQRQQQMNNLVQMFMAMKQYQNEQGWKQKEWENRIGQQAQEKGFEERRIGAYEQGQKRLLEQEERLASRKPDWFSQAEIISQNLNLPIDQVITMMKLPKPTQGRETPQEYADKVRAGEKVRQEYDAPKEEKKTKSALAKEHKDKKLEINRFYSRKALTEGQRYDETAQEFVQNKEMKKANAVMSQKQAYLKQLDDQKQNELLDLEGEYKTQMQPAIVPPPTVTPSPAATTEGQQAFPKVPASKVSGQTGKTLPDGRTIIKINGTWFEVIQGQ